MSTKLTPQEAATAAHALTKHKHEIKRQMKLTGLTPFMLDDLKDELERIDSILTKIRRAQMEQRP